MSHSKNSGVPGFVRRGDESGERHRAADDWDTDTDVMPPEYCRQLLAISRLLQQSR